MAALQNTLFQLKFTTKQLQKQSRKAAKDEEAEKTKLKKALQQGNNEGAKIYAANSIRKHTESLNLLRLSSRIDAVTSRVETAATMQNVSSGMAKVVKNLDKAMSDQNLERITTIMDIFEKQLEDLDVQTNYMESAMGQTTAISTPQDQVDLLMQQVADEAGLEIQHDLGQTNVPRKEVPTSTPAIEVKEDALAQRLRALRPAAAG